VLHFLFRTAGTIPIAPARDNPELLEAAFERIAAYLDKGEVVCIFPEGRLTRDGEIAPFRRGVERILERNPVPVVPMALRGLWDSVFSRQPGSRLARLPRRIWPRVELLLNPPLPASTATLSVLQDQVVALRGPAK